MWGSMKPLQLFLPFLLLLLQPLRQHGCAASKIAVSIVDSTGQTKFNHSKLTHIAVDRVADQGKSMIGLMMAGWQLPNDKAHGRALSEFDYTVDFTTAASVPQVSVTVAATGPFPVDIRPTDNSATITVSDRSNPLPDPEFIYPFQHSAIKEKGQADAYDRPQRIDTLRQVCHKCPLKMLQRERVCVYYTTATENKKLEGWVWHGGFAVYTTKLPQYIALFTYLPTHTAVIKVETSAPGQDFSLRQEINMEWIAKPPEDVYITFR